MISTSLESISPKTNKVEDEHLIGMSDRVYRRKPKYTLQGTTKVSYS